MESPSGREGAALRIQEGFEPKPPWLKVKLPTDQSFFAVADLLKRKGLHTICRSARCPNTAECWSRKTATFLILGNVCTRSCSFCAVTKGVPSPLSPDEPRRVSEAVADLGLDYAVITSVTRDDLEDGGASVFAAVIREIRTLSPGILVEVLVPDFNGNRKALQHVLGENPDVLNHNLEAPESLYPLLRRSKPNYGRSLLVLETAKRLGATTKSGLMLGLGESERDILQALSDLRNVSCDSLTLGQYLRPSRAQAPVRRYYTPDEFRQWKNVALDIGFKAVEAGPLVRSSYNAKKMHSALRPSQNGESCAT